MPDTQEITVMTDTADILIIGGGVMGTSIAYHLVRQAGVRVEVLERQSICSGTHWPLRSYHQAALFQ
ncbi:MAG TPA: hypothetical protein DCL75_10140 [Ktedonobacter sp.]|nr:hypothetical protein [Ktedonobacter sp.]